MKICKKCQAQFKSWAFIEGKKRSLSSRKYCLKCSPFQSHNTKQLEKPFIDKRTWTDDQLIQAVKIGKCYADVLRSLNLKTRGRNWKTIKKHIERLDLDISHFDGQREAVKKLHKGKIKSREEIFCLNSNVSQATLRRRAREQQTIPYRCKCPFVQIIDNEAYYNGRIIKLQLDHKNGDASDNRIENLRWICPNCHSQTPTWGTKNLKMPERLGQLRRGSIPLSPIDCESNKCKNIHLLVKS